MTGNLLFERLAGEAGISFHRTQAEAQGALADDAQGFATPARRRSSFLRDFAGVLPYPRQTAAGINKVIDLYAGASVDPDTGVRTPKV